MKKFLFLSFLTILFFSSGVNAAVFSSSVETVGGDFEVNVDVYNCNNNNVCDVEQNENSSNCSSDCVVVVTTTPTTTDDNVGNAGGGGGGGGGTTVPVVLATSTPIVAPINPIFTATSSDGSALLHWVKTDTSSWKKIIIRRSSLFYPESITAGGLLYDGLGQTQDQINFYFEDKNLTNGQRYYYTIFVLNNDGLYSGGASLSVLPFSVKIVTPPLEVPKQEIPPEKFLPKAPKPQLNPKFSDVIFINNKESVKASENKADFKSGDKISVQIPLNKIPPDTQTGLITLSTETGYQTYVLQKNNNFFGASLPAISEGQYQSDITFLDNNHQVLGTIGGKINFIATESAVRYSVKQNVKSLLSLAKDFVLNSVLNWKRVVGVTTLLLLVFLTKI